MIEKQKPGYEFYIVEGDIFNRRKQYKSIPVKYEEYKSMENCKSLFCLLVKVSNDSLIPFINLGWLTPNRNESVLKNVCRLVDTYWEYYDEKKLALSIEFYQKYIKDREDGTLSLNHPRKPF